MLGAQIESLVKYETPALVETTPLLKRANKSKQQLPPLEKVQA